MYSARILHSPLCGQDPSQSPLQDPVSQFPDTLNPSRQAERGLQNIKTLTLGIRLHSSTSAILETYR